MTKARQDEAERSRKKEAEQVARWKSERRIQIEVGFGAGPQTALLIKPGSGESFRDAASVWAPEMVVVPSGSFLMGSPEHERGRYGEEGPQHEVTIPTPFAVGRYTVTFAEWDAYAADRGVRHKSFDEELGRGRHPVILVSWEDAQAYVTWLSAKTCKQYRLLSESEWEYACRAGTNTAYAFGNRVSKSEAHYSAQKTVVVDAFKPNPWGLYQMHGNVWEWCADVWNESYSLKPQSCKSDAGPWSTGDSTRRIVRGGSCNDGRRNLRSASRNSATLAARITDVGFRVARTLN